MSTVSAPNLPQDLPGSAVAGAGRRERPSVMRRILSRPRESLTLGAALLRGYFYKAYLPLRGQRFRAGRRLLVFGRLIVRGPGRVEFGDRVSVYLTVTPFTHAHDAVIRVGDNTRLSGTRLGCARGITIGADGIIAECRIMDTDFHSVSARRHDPASPVRTEAVEIADNVWIGTDSVIMPGARIGRDSVVSVLTVCATQYPDAVIIAGNPGRAVGKVPDARTAAA